MFQNDCEFFLSERSRDTMCLDEASAKSGNSDYNHPDSAKLHLAYLLGPPVLQMMGDTHHEDTGIYRQRFTLSNGQALSGYSYRRVQRRGAKSRVPAFH